MRTHIEGWTRTGLLAVAIACSEAALAKADSSAEWLPRSADRGVTDNHPLGGMPHSISFVDVAGPSIPLSGAAPADPGDLHEVSMQNRNDEPSPGYGQPAGSDEAAVDRCRVFDGWCSCQSGWTGDLELLGWKMSMGYEFARLDGVDEQLDPDLKCGFRVGVGYRFASCWDVAWRLTSYDNSCSQTVMAPAGDQVFTANWGPSAFPGVTASMNLHYMTNDIELGRWFSLSDLDFFRQASNSLVLRLFGGFRWLDFSETLTTASVGAINPSYSYAHSQAGAYGGRFGVEARCAAADHFHLFASGALALYMCNRSSAAYQLISDDFGNQWWSQSGNPHEVTGAVSYDIRAGVAYCQGPWELSGGYDFTVFTGGLGNFDSTNNGPMVLDGFFLRAALTR